MRARTLIAIFIALVLTIGVTTVWSASTTERDGDTDANVIEDSGSDAGNAVEKKKGGNKVVKVLTAPFKMFGRLFRHNDDNKLQRMTEKDAEKFESVGVARVQDSRSVDLAKVSASASAKEHLAAGRSYLLNGQLNEAISELSTAASLDPKLSEAHNLLGVAYDKKGLADSPKDRMSAPQGEHDDAPTLNNLGAALEGTIAGPTLTGGEMHAGEVF